jgi:tetratricopeptide (TPR) repeat protein
MQDVLFFFFGILGFYILISYKSVSRLWLVSLCFLLSMLSKETGILFIGLALLYLFWWSRKRFFTSIAFMVVPAGLWLALRLNAVGLNNPNIAPIDRLNLVGRLLTLPSILLFYLAKFIFPWKLASGYYWVHPTFSARYVLVPLLIDLAVLGIAIYLGFAVHRKASKTLYHKYLFFSVWLVLGLLTLSQIITLDMTASETWFYFSMSGLLGMIGVAVKTFSKKINPSWLMAIALLLIVLLGFRTLMRGIDWNNKYHLDKLDIAASRQDYVADNDIANILIGQHKYAAAKVYADQSIAIFPYFGNYNNLSTIYLDSGNIAEAKTIFDKGLGYGRYVDIYDNLGEISLVQGNVNSNRLFFAQALNLFPEDGQLWFYKALFDGEHNDNTDAKTDINNAVNFGYPVNQIIYRVIMNGQILAIHTNLGVINLQ